GCAAAMAPHGVGVHRALGDGSQEARAVGQTHRDIAFVEHCHTGGQRRERLGQRRVYAAVHEAGGLLQLVANDDLRTRVGFAHLHVLDTVEAVETVQDAVEVRDGWDGHRAATIAYDPPLASESTRCLTIRSRHETGRNAHASLPMTDFDRLPPDQRAVLSLLLERGQSYGEVADMLAIPERAVRERAHAALDALAEEPASGRRSAFLGEPSGGSTSRRGSAETSAPAERSTPDSSRSRTPARPASDRPSPSEPRVRSAPAGSRRGGLLLLGGIVVAVVVAVIVIVASGSKRSSPNATTSKSASSYT